MREDHYEDLLMQLDQDRLPRHIAVIMDGNGRWASMHHLPRSAGHRAGMAALRALTEVCRDLGIASVTVYAFSTENWRRPVEEIGFLMRLFIEYLRSEVRLMNEQNIRLCFIGKREGLPPEVLAELDKTLHETEQNTQMRLNIAVNYGGRDELTRAVQKLVADALAGKLSKTDVTEELIASELDTAGQPDPDLLIRPSGELRLSNFLLWQSAYSEFYFADKMWPDFGKRDLVTAIIDYQQRDRRFGEVK